MNHCKSKQIVWFSVEPGCFHNFISSSSLNKLADSGFSFTLLSLTKGSSRSKQISKVNNLTIENFDFLSSPSLLLNADIVAIDGYRLPDRLIVLARSYLRKKTIYIQHGIYTTLQRKRINSHVVRKTFYYSLFALLFLFRFLFICCTNYFVAFCSLLGGRSIEFFESNQRFYGLIYDPLEYWILFI